MNILLIETATPVCTVALAHEGHIVKELHSHLPNAHSAKLNAFLRDLFADAPCTLQQVDAVCVGSGPGSYTGLRIGVSSAKGICYALHIPLLAVPTPQAMAADYYRLHPTYTGYVCPMIDARRMECYTALYNSRLQPLLPISATVIEADYCHEWLQQQEVTFIGDGAAKTRPLLASHPHARYDEDYHLSAAGLLAPALHRLETGQVEDVAYFEPYYLKDFVAKKSTVHGLK